VSTLGDELKLTSGAAKGAVNAPRVIGVSLKDRSAIMPVGRGADAAYWLDTEIRQVRDEHVLHEPGTGIGSHVQRSPASRPPSRQRSSPSSAPAIARCCHA
jgi:hypothetical protein